MTTKRTPCMILRIDSTGESCGISSDLAVPGYHDLAEHGFSYAAPLRRFYREARDGSTVAELEAVVRRIANACAA
jgi:hypothetical protein